MIRSATKEDGQAIARQRRIQPIAMAINEF